MFLLSCKIEEGRTGDIDFAELCTAIARRYSDAEVNKPWTVMLYIDRSASVGQFNALPNIFLGRVGGNITFVQNIAHVAGVNRADIAREHGEGHETIRVGDVASASVIHYAEHVTPVSCGISSHDKPGRESVCNSTVSDGSFDWTYEEICGFFSRLTYEGAAR